MKIQVANVGFDHQLQSQKRARDNHYMSIRNGATKPIATSEVQNEQLGAMREFSAF